MVETNSYRGVTGYVQVHDARVYMMAHMNGLARDTNAFKNIVLTVSTVLTYIWVYMDITI